MILVHDTVRIPQSNRRRRPWLAALLSLSLPGLGHLYAGYLAKATGMFIGFVVAGILMLFIVLSVPIAPANIVVGFGGIVIAWLLIAVNAFRRVSRRRRGFFDHWYNKWYIYAALIAVSALVVQPALVNVVRNVWVEAFRLPNDSMAPTFFGGDYVLVRKEVPSELHGRIVVFHAPGNGSPLYIKRVIALPGDTVAMVKKALKVNGKMLAERYVRHVDPRNDVYTPAMHWQRSALVSSVDSARYRPTRDNWGPVVVPPNHVFVLGDDRDDSKDSRYFGFVAQNNIVGYPKRLYFAYRDGIRWERVGQDVRYW